MTMPRRPLIVRLRNWVGDVTLGLPALLRLADAGYELQLLGKSWARDLLAGHGWPVTALAKTVPERVRQLRRLRRDAAAVDPAFGSRINAVCFPYSFSSALEFRLAGLKAIGYAYEGRSFLLGRSQPRPAGRHELEVYWHLASALLGADAPVPTLIKLKLAPAHREQARALCEQHAITPGYVVICPFAGGTWLGQDKTWPGFAAFAAQDLPRLGRRVLICPGPGEEAVARGAFASATLLPDVSLGTYAALLADAALMISNDTGPGHIAAALGTPLISVLGPSDPTQWRPWGAQVQIVKADMGWPSASEVFDEVSRCLAAAG